VDCTRRTHLHNFGRPIRLFTFPRKLFLNLQPPTHLITQFAAFKNSTNGQVCLSGNNVYRLQQEDTMSVPSPPSGAEV